MDNDYFELSVDFFNDPRIMALDGMPDGDFMIVTFLHLLTFAASEHNNGVFVTKEGVPYTYEMFESVLEIKPLTIKMFFEEYEKLGLIKTENGIIRLADVEFAG